MKKIIKFSTSNCGPCLQLKPIFEKVKQSTPGILFQEVDCGVNSELPRSLGIRGVPTLILFDENGTEIKRNVGLVSEQQLRQFIL